MPKPFFTSKHRRAVFATIFLLLLVVLSVWILRYRGTSALREASGPIFGTVYHVKYEASESLDSLILEELKRVDRSLSVFNPESQISRVNRGESNRADQMLYEVLRKAEAVSASTDGAFDVTVMPLVNAWGFGFKNGNLPDDETVDSLRAFVGISRLKLTKDSIIVKDDPRMMIDCGAIAKGYGVDRIASLLREHGVRNYMVEIGGEVVTKGRHPEGHPWKIGVSRPEEHAAPDASLQTVLSLENAAMATSGNYRNYREVNGRKFAHTIDPRTGRPVQHSLLSATVIAPDCATADAYATAFMVIGREATARIVRANRRLKAYLIYADDNGEMQVERLKM